jgi:hypothetical protein
MESEMESKIETKMNCKSCQSALPDLLLASASPAGSLKEQASAQAQSAATQAQSAATQAQIAAAQAHIASCAECARELESLKATLVLLDDWAAPEVSPYFDQKLAVRLREEQASPAASWFEQLRARLLFNTGRQFRPALVTAMAVVLLIGGGGIGISTFTPTTPQAQPSAAVNDLQILDKNEQAIQQMDQLLQEDSTTEDSPAAQPAS